MKFSVFWLLSWWCVPSLFALTYPTPVDLRGKLNRWHLTASEQSLCYRVYADYEEDQLYFGEAVTEAAQQWSSVPESTLKVSACEPFQDEHIGIYLQQNMPSEPYASGYAEFDAYDSQGNPEHCSLYVRTDPQYPLRVVAKTILHEMGHCLGLEHSFIPEAIMSYHSDKNDFSLDVDDKAAISRLYPLQGQEIQLPKGCSIGAQSALPEGLELTPLLVLVFLLPLLLPIFLR